MDTMVIHPFFSNNDDNDNNNDDDDDNNNNKHKCNYNTCSIMPKLCMYYYAMSNDCGYKSMLTKSMVSFLLFCNSIFRISV